MRQNFTGVRVALPETRALDELATMIERRGGEALRCPLVSILDAPEQAPIEAWIEQFIAQPPAWLVLLTGEGLRRLTACAERMNKRDEWLMALTQVQTLTRGPKPAKVLRQLGLQPGASADEPTSAGIIAKLRTMELAGQRIALQLYGEEPNWPVQNCITEQGAQCLPVAPYVYASAADEAKVVALIHALQEQQVAAIAFTSQPQWRRLLKVADKHQLQPALYQGLESAVVAAVGPVMAGVLEQAGVRVDVVPEDHFFMNSMVQALATTLSTALEQRGGHAR